MVHSSDQYNLSLPQKIASAGLAGCTADLATFPLDTVKVWLQVSFSSNFFFLCILLQRLNRDFVVVST